MTSELKSYETLGPADLEYRQGLRASLARDLHDGPIRELTSCVIRLEGFRAVSDHPDMQLAISTVEEQVRAALMSLRHLIRDLRDEPPEEDLVSTIRLMLDRLRPSAGAEIALVASPAWPNLVPGPVALNLLRIVQESVNNAIRHGSADHVLVELTADPDHLEVSVADDGLGIATGSREGTGMLGMRERAALLGGKLTVRRRRPGTEIQVQVPL
jgi:two-component system, NarL family, sensor histidine kinase UhpB